MNVKGVFLAAIFFLTAIFSPADSAHAFSSVLGTSKIAPDIQVYVDGTLVEKAEEEIAIRTNKPSFFGYTLDNVKIELTVQSEPIIRETTSDNSGYWIYQLDEQLDPGVHTLSMNLTDASGASTGAFLASTFKVPDVLSESVSLTKAPTPSLYQLNYFTITLIVFGIALLLLFLYALVKWRNSR